MEEVKLEVLWIDDEPSEPFMDEAYNEGINITNCEFLDDGIRQLKDGTKVWDAIILDANCKITGVEVEPNISALYKAVMYLSKEKITIPWFVYTAKGIDWSDQLKEFLSIENRVWDDRNYYNKPSQRYDLFSNIKKAAAKKEEYAIRKKYADVCNFYKEPDLLALLLRYESEGFETDKNVPHSVRLIIEWIMRYLEGVGLLPISFSGTNIAKCSSSLGDIPQLVPIHVARSMHFCVEVCNNGSHSDEIVSYLVSGEAPYLNKSIMLNLLNILQWCPTLQRYEKEELKKKVKQYQQETKEEREKRKKNIK